HAPTLFPYTTLFRSLRVLRDAGDVLLDDEAVDLALGPLAVLVDLQLDDPLRLPRRLGRLVGHQVPQGPGAVVGAVLDDRGAVEEPGPPSEDGNRVHVPVLDPLPPVGQRAAVLVDVDVPLTLRGDHVRQVAVLIGPRV